MVEKIVLKESMQNLPDWFTKNASKDVLAKINNQGIDLHNCKFTEISKKTNRAPEWNNGDVIVFLFEYDDSWSNGKHHEDVVAYIPGYDYTFGPYKYDDWSRKQLLDKASKVAVISKADASNLKPDKDSYEDPRDLYSGEYGGQKKDTDYWGDDAEWETPNGRDKSGYEIPTPEYWQVRLFNYNFKDTYNKYRVSLEDLYNRIESAKNRLFDSIQNKYDISNYDVASSSAISNAFSNLGSACRYYQYVLKELDRLKEYRDKSMDSSNKNIIESFNRYYKWAVEYLRDLEKFTDEI